jgi:uncharacterized ion transporter superfamily protein YfcC
MNKLFSSIVPVAIALAASLGCAAAHGATSQGNASTPVIAHATASVKTQHGLTRREVYDQLVQAEKDGSLARINALYMGS